MAGHVVQPVSDSSWNMPGYTGFVQGLKETLGSTPVTAQYKAAAPALGEFLHTRRFVPPILTPSRDPCNFPDSFKASGEQVNLWPSLQTTGTSSVKLWKIHHQLYVKAAYSGCCLQSLQIVFAS